MLVIESCQESYFLIDYLADEFAFSNLVGPKFCDKITMCCFEFGEDELGDSKLGIDVSGCTAPPIPPFRGGIIIV